MSHKKLIFGLILIIVGFFLLLNTLDLLYYTFEDVMRFLVPTAFIAIGIWLIVRRRKQEQYPKTDREQTTFTYQQSAPETPPRPSEIHEAQARATFTRTSAQAGADARYTDAPAGMTPEGKLRYSKTFGDMFIDFTDMGLANVEVSSGFGDVELKVHGGKLDPGLNRIVISGFIGDIRVMIPRDMEVFVHCSNFIGDVEALGRRASRFSNNLDAHTSNYNDAERKLYIAANSFIGDIRVLVV